MRLNGQKVAFVNCHLAAHAEKVAKRIENIKNIIKDVHFGRYNQVEFATQYVHPTALSWPAQHFGSAQREQFNMANAGTPCSGAVT